MESLKACSEALLTAEKSPEAILYTAMLKAEVSVLIKPQSLQ